MVRGVIFGLWVFEEVGLKTFALLLGISHFVPAFDGDLDDSSRLVM